MKFRSKDFCCQLICIFCVLAFAGSVGYAQGYPTRGIDIVIPNAAGGGSDNFYRTAQPYLSKELGVPINIVNRAGGGGVIGTSFVANSKPDGYTLFAHSVTGFLTPQIISPKTIPYDVLKDFTPIVFTVYEPLILVARPDLGVKTFKEFIAFAKKNPGKLVCGVSGLGSPNRIDLEILKTVANVNIRHISFDSGAETLTQLLGGHIDWIIGTIPVSKPHIQIGKLRALAVLSTERLPEFPDVPTMIEEGYPDVNVNMEYILMGPKSLPPEITKKLANAMQTVLKKPEMITAMKRRGYVDRFLPPKEFSDHLVKTFNRYNEIAKKTPGMITE